MTNRFVIQGAVKPKQRPRFSRRSGVIYTPKATMDSEADIKKTFRSCFPGKIPTLNPIEMLIRIYIEQPKYISKNKKKAALANAGKLRPSTKPDLDNLAKTICDALNGVMYKDDSQIVKLTAEKYYSRFAQDCAVVEWIVLPLF